MRAFTRRSSAATRSMACSTSAPTRPAPPIARSSASASSAAPTPSASGSIEKPWKQHGPDPALLDGRGTTSPGQRHGRLDLHERQALAVRRHRNEERRLDQGPRRLGASRPAAAGDCRTGSARPRAGLLARPAAKHRIHGDDLSRAPKATWSSTPPRSGGPTA